MNQLSKLALITLMLVSNIGAGHSADSVEDQLRRVADETRKSLPMMVGDGIQATNIAAVGKTMLAQFVFRGT